MCLAIFVFVTSQNPTFLEMCLLLKRKQEKKATDRRQVSQLPAFPRREKAENIQINKDILS